MRTLALLRDRLLLALLLLGSVGALFPLSGFGAGVVHHERVEISAPILPRVLVLYAMEAANYPTSTSGESSLAHSSALTFGFLLKACAATRADIVVSRAGDPPTTPAQNASNYEAIANCAYQDFVSKPYWIPSLVNHVDICGAELGSDWRLISEDDLSTLTEADARSLAAALSTPQSSSYFGNFYFSLSVWVRGSDGSLKQGDLSPGVSPRVAALPVSPDSKTHYEGALALRCIRRTALPNSVP